MGQLTREAEERILRWVFVDRYDPTLQFAQPVEVRLMGTNGDSSVAGTEIVANSYEPVDTTWIISSYTPGVEIVNAGEIEFILLDTDDDISVNGVELWDSSATPVRIAYVGLVTSFIVAAGYPFTIAAGQLKVRLT